MMTSDDLDRIEEALGIRLSIEYREFMINLESPECEGNADCDLWDDAGAIIKRNLELREGINVGGAQRWPDHMFFIGDPLSACGNAIDLDAQGPPVFWMDHCDLDAPSSGKIADSFVSWAKKYVDEIG